MYRLFFLVILYGALFKPLTCSAQVQTNLTPQWIEKIKFDPYTDTKEYQGKTSDGQLYLLVDRQDNVEKQTKFRHYAYKLLTTKGVQNYSEISINYDPSYQSIVLHKLVIHRNGAAINKLIPSKFNTIQKEEDSESLIYDGSLTSYINLEDVRVNDVIEYSYSIIGFNPIKKGKYSSYYRLQFSVPVDIIHVRILNSTDLPLHIKCHNSSSEPKIIDNEGTTVYSWLINKSFGILKDDNLPSWFNPYNSVSISQYDSWESLGKELAEFYTFKEDNSMIKTIAENISSSHHTIEERINESIRFVQNEIRYLGLEDGISSYKPRSPQQIIKQRFGDCKDKSLLLVSLLNQFGVRSKAVLVNTYDKDRIAELSPAPGSFNHCVINFEFKDSTIWIDPTIREQGGNLNERYFPNYKLGLVLDDANPKLIPIPKSIRSNVKIEESLDISSATEAHEYRIKTTYYGNSADIERKNFNESNIDEISKDYLDYYTDLYDCEIQVLEEISYESNDSANTFTVFESYQLKNIWKKSKGYKDRLQAEISNTSVSDFFQKPSSSIRKMPYSISYPKKLEVISTVKLPTSWDDDLSKKIEAPGLFASIGRKYNNNTCTFHFCLETTKSHLMPDEIDEYIKAVELLDEHEGRAYYYSPSSSGNDVFSKKFSNLLIYSIIPLLMFVRWGRYIYRNYNPGTLATNIEPMKIGGWLVFPTIGVFLIPIMLVFYILLNESYNDQLLTVFSSNKLSSIKLTNLISYLFQLFQLVFSVLLIVLFLKKRTSFPKLIIIFYAINLIVIALIVVISTGSHITSSYEISDVISAMITCAIWVPYFLVSERVKKTFIIRT